MDKASFEEMLSVQDSHWWFKGKRKVIQTLLKRLQICRQKESARILEIGCGTGGNLKLLSQYGKVKALELDDYARAQTTTLPDVEVLKGWLPDGMDAVEHETFDLICMFDVLEHVQDDDASLAEVRNFLKPNAKLFITVPAYQWMFSVHDARLGHFRRYNKTQLCKQCLRAGYKVSYAGYMNMLALPLMLGARLFDRLWDVSEPSGMKTPVGIVNFLLYALFFIESLWIPYIHTPCGGSVVVVAERDESIVP